MSPESFEQDLVRRLARPDAIPPGFGIGPHQPPSNFSWERVVDIAARNWVSPAVAANLRSGKINGLPANVERQAAAGAIAAKIALQQKVEPLKPILERLDLAAIPYAFLKGAALIAGIYPEHTRLLNDVDLLIPSNCVGRVSQWLEEAGYQARPERSGIADDQWYSKGQMAFVRQEGAQSMVVDLHMRMCSRRRLPGFETKHLLRRSTFGSLLGIPVRRVSNEDLLIHYASQLVNDEISVTLLRLADIAMLLERVDLETLAVRAKTAGVGQAVTFAQCAAAAFFDVRTDPLEPQAVPRLMSLVASLRRRGWGWIDGAETELPYRFRRVAAAMIEGGRRAGIRKAFSSADEYRRRRRLDGASTLRSAAGGLRYLTKALLEASRLTIDQSLRLG